MTTTTLDLGFLEPYVDHALASGQVVAVGHVVLMPDVAIAELVANGDDVPPTWEVERADGRSVYVFRMPAGVVA